MVVVQHLSSCQILDFCLIPPESYVSTIASGSCLNLSKREIRWWIPVNSLKIGADEGLYNVDKVVEDHEDVSIAAKCPSIGGVDTSHFCPVFDEQDQLFD